MSNDNEIIWNRILSAIKSRMNHESYETWVEPLMFLGYDEQFVNVVAPSEVYEEWLMTQYKDLLEESLTESGLAGRELRFEFAVSVGAGAEHLPLPETRGDNYVSEKKYPGFESSAPKLPTPSITIIDNNHDKDHNDDSDSSSLPINRDYSFDSFVVGSCNQFAHAASLAVAEQPSTAYNPLYIYGGVGLGKTHLMCAIGHHLKEHNRHLRLRYISSEKFVNEMINALRYDQTATFREKYRSVDVLLIDDIQFISGKERTQEEFFHTFNALYERQKQIVISSDCPPREIPSLEERLHSRFEWGLIADIQPPDLETKVAIIRKRAEAENINLPDNVALFIANKIKSNIRELEGSLITINARASNLRKPITIDLAQEILIDIRDEEKRPISIDLIQKIVAEHYDLRVADLKSKTNARDISFPRQVAMYLCKMLTKSSLPEIGREFGGKHHTTVLHSVHKITTLYDENGNIHRDINNLIDRCK